MRKNHLTLVMLAAPFCLMAASEDLSTWTWDTAANTVTLSYAAETFDDQHPVGSTYTVPIAKFSSAMAAAREGTSKTYALTGVTISTTRAPDYWIGGTSTVSSPRNLYATFNAPVVVNGTHIYTADHETWTDTIAVPPNDSVSVPHVFLQNGLEDPPVAADITPSLDSLTGTDSYSMSFEYLSKTVTADEGVSLDRSLDVAIIYYGYTISYTYAEVTPEPTTAALALAALAFLGVRRRVEHDVM
jgi:MYXO-CTERM domain-containing protein